MISSKGRMIRKDISRSQKIASLSKEATVLFVMLIPHFSSFGKMNGSPYFVKGEVVPLLEWFTIPLVERCLKEISEKTNVKWFTVGGLWYLHSVNWEEHQEIRKDRVGKDDLPDYSGTTPGLLRHEVEVEVEVEVQVEGQVQKRVANESRPTPKKRATQLSDEEWMKSLKSNPAYQGIDIEVLKAKMEAWCDLKGKRPTRARLLNWLNREDRPLSSEGKPVIQASRGAAGGLARVEELRRQRLEKEAAENV